MTEVATAVTAGPALVVRAPGNIGLEQRPMQAPGALEVQITPIFVGVCGTDLEILDGGLDPHYIRYPIVLGHEWSGTVSAVGPEVQTVTVGDRVVVEGIRPDGVCRHCRAGRTNLCEMYDELGFTRDGAAAPVVNAPQHLVHRIADDLPLEVGALVEPMAVVLRGLLELKPARGARVLILGDGTVGLLAAHLVRLWSPSEVVVAGRRPAQQDLALRLGATRFQTDDPEPRAFDTVIEAAGSTTAVETAFRAARRGGSILLLGIAGHNKTVSVNSDDIVDNDLQVRGSFAYTAEAWRLVVALLGSGDLTPLPLITHRFPLTDFQEAITTLRGGAAADEARGKILLTLNDSQ